MSSRKYRQQKRVSDLTKKFLAQKYMVEGMAAAEIARETKHGKATVLKYLKKYGIPRRKIWER